MKGNERKCKVMKGEKIQFAFLSAEEYHLMEYYFLDRAINAVYC